MAGHVARAGANRVRANPLRRGGGRARGGTGPSVTSSQQLYVKVNLYKNKGNRRSAPMFRCPTRFFTRRFFLASLRPPRSAEECYASREGDNVVNRMVCDAMLNSSKGSRDVVVVTTRASLALMEGRLSISYQSEFLCILVSNVNGTRRYPE